mmetsp:Transcript_11460/g.1714  ORF Transcript_11460/g.1714 Transcript_11460/m.1714 type:complete len:148 (+) Transcript_11460:172-615(+)
MGSVWSDKYSLFAELPKQLRYEIATSMHNGVANDLIFFMNKDPSFVIDVMPLLKPCLNSNQSFLYREGEHADEVYFIVKGKIDLTLLNSGISYKTYLTNSYLGEIEILCKCNRLDNAQGTDDAEFLVLAKHDFITIMNEFHAEAVEI